jgi:hypothetical protein
MHKNDHFTKTGSGQRSFYQDRLRTNTGKTQKRRVSAVNLNRVNAVCQALASLFRAVLPLSAGALWSALMEQPWPIQPHGLYIGLSLLALWMVVNGRMLDPQCGAAYSDRVKVRP